MRVIKTIPFSIGDVVQVKRGPFKGKNTIKEVGSWNGDWSYASEHGAWIDHEDCTLIQKATLETLNEAFKADFEEEDWEEE